MRVALCAIVIISALAVVSAGRIRSNHIGALNEGLKQRGVDNQSLLQGAATDLYFTQTLDHFDRTNNATWQQRYILNDTTWRQNGPILFVLGGEGPISPAYVSGHFITGQLAAEFGALQVALEHRFYGQSVPNGDSSTANLRYLSSEQALADAAVFREFIVNKYNCQNCPIIIFGGSYSGCLSAWLKAKYPQLFTGAYATSAPVNAELDFFQYFQVVQNSVGPTCAARIKAANDRLDQMMTTPAGRASAQTTYQTCSPIVTDKDVATFFDSVAGSVSGVVQYNMDNVAYQPCNITKMCDIIENSDPDPVVALANFNNLANNFSGSPCTEVNYTDYIQSLIPTSAGRSWTYQTCVEFGFYQTAETDDQPFSRSISLKYFTDMCNDLFGNSLLPDTTWTNTNYGSLDLASENTFTPNGDVDPWHALGITDRVVGPESATVLIKGTAHCADLYMPRAEDLPSLTAARAIGHKLMENWLYSKH